MGVDVGISLFRTKYTGQNLVKGLIICNPPTPAAIHRKLKFPV
jgi:hypothetical protein